MVSSRYSITCSKQQETVLCFKGKVVCTLGGVDKIGIAPDRTGSDRIGPDWITDHRKKSFKEKKFKNIKSFMS